MHTTRREFAQKALLASAGLSTLVHQAAAQSTQIYIVKKGDTLSHIAARHGTTVNELKQTNGLSSDMVRIGQKLHIPNSSAAGPTRSTIIHTVAQGDTLGHIAIHYQVSVSSIKQANNLNSDLVRIGQKLAIPGASSTATTTPSTDLLSVARRETAKINVRTSNWKRIVAHHSAIKYGNAAKYDSAHRRRGMQNGLAYHFVIGNGIDSGDGEIEVGPRWKKQLLGGHVKSYQLNLTAIGICLVGNFEETHPSRKQLDAFKQLMDWLQSEVLQRKPQFAGHKELRGEQTICPGRNFPLAAMHARYD